MGNDQEFTKDIENTNKNQAEIPNTVVLDQPISDPATDAKIAFYKKPNFLRFSLYGIAAIAVVLMFLGIGSLIVHATMPPINENSEPTATALILPEGVTIPPFSSQNKSSGVSRAINLNVDFRSSVEERTEVIEYTVEEGDSIFAIADKFGLKPETVLWSNRYIIGDTPDGLVPGIQLYILPMDGVYHRWSEGEGLNGVASFYGVSPDVIVDFEGNNLDRAVVGDFANPNIPPETMLVVPGGIRPTIAWIVPRDSPASAASYLGPGACAGNLYGIVGTGTFTWPTTEKWLSGYDWNPPVHNGLDFAGRDGFSIFASDSGVIVYSGWSDRGYGNLIVIDHDRGWQTFYAHLLDNSMLPCGTNVQKGQLIAAMGNTGRSTGSHLHFEIRLNGHPVNPWQFIQ